MRPKHPAAALVLALTLSAAAHAAPVITPSPAALPIGQAPYVPPKPGIWPFRSANRNVLGAYPVTPRVTYAERAGRLWTKVKSVRVYKPWTNR